MTLSLASHRQTWFTADLHFGHERVIDLCRRPFTDADTMNAALIDRWNERVDRDDTVYVLGDVAMSNLDRSLALIKYLSGKKILVAGNHDRCFHGYDFDNPARRDELVARAVDRYRVAGFSSVVTGQAIAGGGKPVTLPLRLAFGGNRVATVSLSHFPHTGESQPGQADRYVAYRPPVVLEPRPSVVEGQPRARRQARWLLHGHVHNAWTVNDRQINVGVDVWDFAPVSADVIAGIVADGMPACGCASPETHGMGAPGCIINGGPVDEPGQVG
jgi:calcineurin-like phosphoesterase family protein